MWTYGATSFTRLTSKGIRAGQRVADAGERVPVGDVHAVDDHGNAACGIAAIEAVFDQPVEWGTRSFLTHCRACQVAAGEST